MKGKVSGSFSVSKAKENADNRTKKGILLRTGTLTTVIGLTREQSPEKAGLRSNGATPYCYLARFRSGTWHLTKENAAEKAKENWMGNQMRKW